MKAFSISTRYTAAEIRQLDRTAKTVGISRAELVRIRALGKIITTHQLADWAETTLAINAGRKSRHASRAA